MRLVTGGMYQGKLEYVLKNPAYGDAEDGRERIIHGSSADLWEPEDDISVLNAYHILVRRQLEAGADVHGYIEKLIRKSPRVTVISDDIGSGIIPVEEELVRWRETLGRELCRIAEMSDCVVRVVCGIGVRVK